MVVTVDGVALRAADVDAAIAQAGRGHDGRDQPDRRAVVEGLVNQQLRAAEAVELGLDQDPEFVDELRRKEAEVAAWRRRELARAFNVHAAEEASAVGDGDVRAYFAEHEAEIRTDRHVWQILRRDRDQIDQAKAALDAGEPFEAVAFEKHVELQAMGQTPWDLGFLRWSQIPEPWRAPLAGMEPGQTSDVIAGPSGRFWIVRVIDVRKDDTLTFDEVRPLIETALVKERLGTADGRVDAELRSRAEIVWAEELP